MNINDLIAIVKKKLQNNIVIEKIKIEDKTFLHKNHLGHQEGNFHLKLIISSAELKKLNNRSPKYVTGDLRKPEICNEIMQHTLGKVPKVDILINNAAIQPSTSLENITEKEVSEMLTINLATPLLLIQAFSKQKIDNGSVVNISSIEAIRPAINHSHYASTKAGLLNLTMSSAIELGKKNIRVNSVAPTFVETPMVKRFFKNNKFKKMVLSKIPIGKVATESDIATTVCFLASSASSMITGTSIIIDGGWTAQ